MSEEEAKGVIRNACESCIREGILQDFLTEHMEEIIMSEWWEFDQKEHDQVLGDERYEDGFAAGKAEGKADGLTEGTRNQLVNDVRKLMETLHISLDQAMAALEVPEKDRSRYAKLVEKEKNQQE